MGKYLSRHSSCLYKLLFFILQVNSKWTWTSASMLRSFISSIKLLQAEYSKYAQNSIEWILLRLQRKTEVLGNKGLDLLGDRNCGSVRAVRMLTMLSIALSWAVHGPAGKDEVKFVQELHISSSQCETFCTDTTLAQILVTKLSLPNTNFSQMETLWLGCFITVQTSTYSWDVSPS